MRHRNALPLFLALSLSGCAGLLKEADISGLRDIGTRLAADLPTGTPEDLTAYMAAADPFATPVPGQALIRREPLDRWDIKDAAHPDIIRERLSFPSPLGDRAVFYLFRTGSLVGNKAILWVPGYGVSDFAFTFIQRLFRTELDQGYAILFYTIPYHLERTEKGKSAGEGLLSADIVRNLRVLSGAIADLRTGMEFLRVEGVSTVGGWGGSIGAALLWNLSARERLDHMALMIPVVDWTTLLFHPELASAMKRLEDLGFKGDLLSRAYAPFSPVNIRSLTDPARILVQYGRWDQLTPEPRILDFARNMGIGNVRGYGQSHASILLDPALYADHASFLRDLGALHGKGNGR